MGVAMPQRRFCRARPKEKISRGQAWASEMGAVKSPKLERTPKLTMATRQPATITTAGVKYQGICFSVMLMFAGGIS